MMTGLLVLVTSCTKNFEEINTNPNAPDQAPMTNVLGYVITSLGARFGETEMIYPASFAGHMTKANYTDAVVYLGKPSSSVWTGTYSSISRNANAIIEEAVEKGNLNMQAAAMVLKAYAMQMVTDVYGPCPYFEAGKGDEGLIHPVFDSEEEIYRDLFEQLETAADLFTTESSSGLLGVGDLNHGGRVDKWIKFIYADTTSEGIYDGLEVGEEGLGKSKAGPHFIQNPAGSVKFLTYAEVEFIKAEAGARNMISLDAGAAYEAGISASMKEYDIADTAITAYLAGPHVTWNNDVAQVNLQKWLSLFHQSWEAWAEMRRTDIPLLGPAANSEKPGHNRPPFRFSYPETEISLNSDNIPDYVNEEDTYWGYQLWWDTRNGVQ